MWGSCWRRGIRRLYATAAALRQLKDEGDWSYASEWWGVDSDGQTVFRSASVHGNGVVSVSAYPSSKPDAEHWPAIERWLQQRNAEIYPEHGSHFKILGYQWRCLRFNDDTRQSTAKVMAVYRKSDPSSIYLMQQPHCMAVPYLKSMVSAGLTTLASFSFDFQGAAFGKRTMNILCIGHGGGALPLFLASKIKGAIIHIVEIDPVVISASVQAMGFPSSAVKEKSEHVALMPPANADQLFYGDVHKRLFLHRSDAEDFVLNDLSTYDLIFIDAYDGDDIFPYKLWDPDAPFLRSLRSRLHPVHGTVVVNLHSDSEVFNPEESDHSHFQSILPMGKHVSNVCRAYKEHMGFAFTVSVPFLCNLTLVACSGVGLVSGRNGVLLDTHVVSNLVSKSCLVEHVLDLPFPCTQYIKRGFRLVG